MSHVDAGPLANYNSLLDPHLSGYFSSTRIKKHLRKAGLVTRDGVVVTENEFRLRMARKEHRRQVRDMLASAIVNKTLDMERQRQVLIRRKLEEIASIELVKQVKAHRKFGYEAAIEDMVKLNLLGKSQKASNQSLTGEAVASESQLPHLGPVQLESVQWSQKKLTRPSSGPPQSAATSTPDASSRGVIRVPRAQSGPTARAGRNYQHDSDVTDEDDDEAETEHLWSRSRTCLAADETRSSERPQTSMKLPVGQQAWQSESSLDQQSPLNSRRSDRAVGAGAPRPRSRHVDRQPSSEGGISSRDLDPRYLSTLDRAATERYGLLLDKEEAGRHESPYIENAELLAPRPPMAQRPGSVSSSGRRRPAARPAARQGGTNVPRDEHGHPIMCPKRSKGTLMLHRSEPAFKIQDQVQTFCEVSMRYFGSHISLERDGVDPRHQILVEQQHCGGSTLVVFKELLLPKSDFTFTSRRHSGYPFSLTFYVDGIQDIRLSACCEYKHRKGYRLGGKTGHFGFVRISGSVPCYRCEVERDARIKSKAKRRTEDKIAVNNVTAALVDTSVAADPPNEPATELEQKSGEEAENQEYNDDFDVEDEAQGKFVSSRQSSIEKPELDIAATQSAAEDSDEDEDSEQGVLTYEDDFGDDEVEKHTQLKPLEIAVADDSDEEERRLSKDMYQPARVVKALNIPMPEPENAQSDQSTHTGEAITSDWLLTVHSSKQVVQKPPTPPQSNNGERHSKLHKSNSSGDKIDNHPGTSTSGNNGWQHSEEDVSDDDSDLFGMTDSTASSAPPSGRQSPLPPAAQFNDADQDAATAGFLDEGHQQAPASPGRTVETPPPSSGRQLLSELHEHDVTRAAADQSPPYSSDDEVESIQSSRDSTSSVMHKVPEKPAVDSEPASEIDDDYELPIPGEKPAVPTHGSSSITPNESHSLVSNGINTAASASATADVGTDAGGSTISQDHQQDYQQAVATSTFGIDTNQAEQQDQVKWNQEQEQVDHPDRGQAKEQSEDKNTADDDLSSNGSSSSSLTSSFSETTESEQDAENVAANPELDENQAEKN